MTTLKIQIQPEIQETLEAVRGNLEEIVRLLQVNASLLRGALKLECDVSEGADIVNQLLDGVEAIPG